MKKNYFKNLAQVAVLLCAPLFIASCDEFGTEDNPAGAYPSMSTAAVTINLKAGVDPTYTRTAVVASPAYVDYSSSDEKVATVDGFGVVTAVGGGTCEIIAKPYFFKDGGKLYTKEEIKYPVTVKDWRAKVKFSTTEATVNSADIDDKVYKFAKADIVYPADATVTYNHTAVDGGTDLVVQNIDNTTGVITLKAGVKDGVSLITATITGLPAGYETTTFTPTAKFTLTVKEGIAYISGYDAEAKPIRSTMFLKGADGKDQYKTIDAAWVAAQGANATLDGGIYYVTAVYNKIPMNIKIKDNATFILADGSNFEFDGSLIDDTPNSHIINIYGQKAQTGKLHPYGTAGDRVVDFKEINVYGGELNVTCGADGSGAFNKIGAINIFKGGFLYAENYANYGYGIKMNTGGKVTVDAGKLELKGKGSNADDSYALIGDVTVKNKGEMKASSADYRAVNGTVTATTAKETDATTWTWDATDKTYDGKWASFTGTSTKKYVWAK